MEREHVTTIQDVARAAGVAASTVSRYLNGQLRVSPATEAKVLEAVSQLGYVPNAQARNLARRRSGVIGFVVPEISNPYFGAIADYVVEAVERHGRLVLLCSHRSQAVRQSSYIDLLVSGAIDGMLYLGSFRSNERLAAAIAGGLAVVVVDEPITGLPPVHTRAATRPRATWSRSATARLLSSLARGNSARCRNATAATPTR
jgi:LacI family transcriptional regulator/LacI family repressor for deo operon, udp, cdd, tsx, nupC, and nupG